MIGHRKITVRKHAKGQEDHIDAWLMSYADMITLLFMLFVIFVSVTVSKQGHIGMNPPPEPVRDGLMKLGTPYDELFRDLQGVVVTRRADQHIAVEKNETGMWIDMSAVQFFGPGSAEIPQDQMPLLKLIAQTLKTRLAPDDLIEVAGYTDDKPLKNSKFADNWDLASMRAAHVVKLLIAEGIDPRRLRATSYAGTRPLVPNTDTAGNAIAENQARNQRVVIRVEKAISSPWKGEDKGGGRIQSR